MSSGCSRPLEPAHRDGGGGGAAFTERTGPAGQCRRGPSSLLLSAPSPACNDEARVGKAKFDMFPGHGVQAHPQLNSTELYATHGHVPAANCATPGLCASSGLQLMRIARQSRHSPGAAASRILTACASKHTDVFQPACRRSPVCAASILSFSTSLHMPSQSQSRCSCPAVSSGLLENTLTAVSCIASHPHQA